MDYAIEGGDYKILKVVDKGTKEHIWIKSHLFNESVHKKIKGEVEHDKSYLSELAGGDPEMTGKKEEDVQDENDTENEDQESQNEAADENDEETENSNYDSLKKADLIAIAQSKGIEVDPTMKKSEIIELLNK